MLQKRPHQAKVAGPRPRDLAALATGLSRRDDDFLIVGIGASAGGLDACRKLVDALPRLTNAAIRYVAVQIIDHHSPRGDPGLAAAKADRSRARQL